MAETLKEVIERIKLKKSSQTQAVPSVQLSKPAIPVPLPSEEEEEFLDEEIEEITADKPKAKQEIAQENQIMMQIEMLQNDGRYRVELLHQLQEINKALIVIAGALA